MIYPHSQIWTPQTISDIHQRAQGQYQLTGFRPLHDLPSFDDLVFLASGLTRFPLEGYKEKCKTETTIGGGRSASRPLVLETPVWVASPPGLEPNVRVELARGCGLANTAISMPGKVSSEEKKVAHRVIQEVPVKNGGSSKLASQPSLRNADAIQLNVGVGTSTEAVHRLVTEVKKRQELKVPILVSFPAARVEDEVKAAVRAGADGIVLLGLRTDAVTDPRDLFDYCRIPTIATIPRAREALRDSKVLGQVSLMAGTGVRNGADASKAIALGADAVRIDEAALIAVGYYTSAKQLAQVAASSSAASPPKKHARNLKTVKRGSGIRVAKFINSMTMEIALLARSLGKGDVHSLEYEDLSALTMEASLMSGVRLAGE